MTICVASTVAGHKANNDEEVQWLAHADDWMNRGDVQFFAALQVGQGHDHKLDRLRRDLDWVNAAVWNFSIDDGTDQVTSGTRITYICTGRNLAHEFVNPRQDITHLLFLDSDTRPPVDLIDRLVELDHPVVGANVPSYGLSGPPVAIQPSWHQPQCAWGPTKPFCSCEAISWDVREHALQTAGCLMLTREAVNSIRWGWAVDRGMTDDPWTEGLAEKVGLGKVWVRHDVTCEHFPNYLVPLEDRGVDLSVKR